MKPYTQPKDDSLTAVVFLTFNVNFSFTSVESHLTKTPKKNKSSIMEVQTVSNLELTPLVSPRKLGTNNTLAHQSCRLEIVQTPLVHRGNFMPYMDQYTLDNRQ